MNRDDADMLACLQFILPFRNLLLLGLQVAFEGLNPQLEVDFVLPQTLHFTAFPSISLLQLAELGR